MAYGQTLQKLLQDLRAEIGIATAASVSQSENDSLKVLIQRTQEMLYDDHDWKHLSGVWYDATLSAGQRYYSYPSGLNSFRAHRAYAQFGGQWDEIPATFGPQAYNSYDSDVSTNRSDPPQAIRRYSLTEFEIWPIPATNGITVRFVGMRNLTALTADAHIADLDDRLIVLHAAAERLAGKPRGQALAGAAQRRLDQCLANQAPSAVSFRPGENAPPGPRDSGVTIRIAGA